MSFKIMSDEFDSLDANEKAGIGATLIRCRLLAAKIANELRLDKSVDKSVAHAHRPMTTGQKDISVCICTFHRPGMLRKLLARLEEQRTNGRFTFSVVVTDNDSGRSSERVVAEFVATSRIVVTYTCESRQNIALARNEALKHATGDFVAFIDDDEFPENGWLEAMLEACEKYQAAGVLGPVRPHFEEPPPRWIIDGHFCERPEHQTGRVMEWEECRTGN